MIVYDSAIDLGSETDLAFFTLTLVVCLVFISFVALIIFSALRGGAPEDSSRPPLWNHPFSALPMETLPAIETPRLGIRHLMVLTACVAAYLGVFRALGRAFDSGTFSETMPTDEALVSTFYAIAGGAALAGMFLFAARRVRGMTFPFHPGEFLSILLGIGVVWDLVRTVVFNWVMLSGNERSFDLGGVYTVMGIGALVIHVAWWIWALVRLKRRRWRVFLVSMPVCHILAWVSFFSFSVFWSNVTWAPVLSQLGGPILICVMLGIVVLRDHVRGLRYPWTHWFGVAVYFWRTAALTVNYTWYFLQHANR